jgi:putative CocE/NonD family hydrolase
LSAWRAVARRWLALPPPACKVTSSCEWLPASDGTRLATRIVRPAGTAARATVLMRSAAEVHERRHATARVAELLAEQGVAVVVQECRGLRASEGRFEPFVHEPADGRDALAWLAAQSWFARPLCLAGFGYGGYAAWAALSASPAPVERLVAGYTARDPYAWLHAGGALRQQAAFELAFALGAAERDSHGASLLERALRHRPLREADRVGFRRLDWLREWLDHPARDEFWERRTPALPQRPPDVLMLGGWGHAALGAALADHAALAASSARTGSGSVALEIGDASPTTRGQAWRRLRDALDAALHFLLPEPARRAPVRVFDVGASRWRELASWPPPRGALRRLHLRGDGRAHGADGDGRLDAEPPGALEPPDRFLYDPADATPSGEQAASRGDVLCFASAPLPEPLRVCGAVKAELHVASDVPATDFCARLVALDAAGNESELCEGVTRLAPQAEGSLDAPRRLEIACGATCHSLATGSRLRLEIGSASHPRFDRAPNTREEPARAGADAGAVARQTLFHDAARPSLLAFDAGDA